MKPITIMSLMDIRFAASPRLSPDGRKTAFVVGRPNWKENRYDRWLYIVDNADGRARQMTFAGKEAGFIWEDGNTLLFEAERQEADKPPKHGKKTVFYRLDIRGGEARRAFEVPLKVTGIEALGGGRFLLAAETDLNAPDGDMDETLRDDLKDYHVLEEIPFWGNERGYISRIRTALYRFDAADGGLKKLTGDYFNVSHFDVRHGRVVYSGVEYRDRISPFGAAKLCDIETGETRDLVEPGKYSVGEALLTDSGAMLALSTLEPWGTGQLHDWYRVDLETLALHLSRPMEYCIGCAAALDCSGGAGTAARAVGETVVFTAQREYRTELYRLNPDDTLETVASFEGNVLALDADGDNLVFTAQAPDGLCELYALKDGMPQRLTGLNADFLSGHRVAHAQYLPFTNADGVHIDGWVLKPADFDAEKHYPGVLEIHGGPRGAYGPAFFHEMQALCGAGYIVFFCNPRGSEGYGEAFADLRGRYGTIDYDDLMAFTTHVLEAVPQLDPKRLGACGGSYGGFMCNWIEGHTDRFAAIASQRSISNWVSDFGASEIGFTFDVNELGGDPWTAHDRLWAQSPLKYADRASTPILFIHSLCDYNCTVDQGLEMFTAMKYFGVPTRMCLFEGENHSLSRSGKPRHRVRRLEEIINWFDRYLK